MAEHKFFRKPTAFATAAAAIGVSLHLAVFFLFRIDFEKPTTVSRATPTLSFAGNLSSTDTALVDPLVLLLSSQRTSLPGGVRNFREISISREISPHPPSLLIRENQDWTAWVPTPEVSTDASTWIIGRTVNPLRDFAMDPSLAPSLDPNRLTVQIEDLRKGTVHTSSVPLPPDIKELFLDSTSPNPLVFLHDRSDPYLEPEPLLISSSGNLPLDRAVGRAIKTKRIPLSTDRSYLRLTFYFPSAIRSQKP